MQFKELDEEIEKISKKLSGDNKILQDNIEFNMHYLVAFVMHEHGKISRGENEIFKPDEVRHG